MNTLSKVFVVVNLVFATAFCFMTLTLYSKRVDYKEQLEVEKGKHETTKTDKQEEIKVLTVDRDKLASSLRETTQQNKTFFERNAELQQENKTSKVAFFEEEQERKLLGERIQATTLELDRRYSHINQMHMIVLTQQRALEIAKSNMRSALNEKMEMENESNNARLRLVASQKEKARLEKDLHHNSWIIQKLHDSGVPVQDMVFGSGDQPDIDIHGKVLAVRPKVNLVMVSVGSDQKVRKGYRFVVYRGEKYIGKIEIEKVFANMCSAHILGPWTRGMVKEGDDVMTMGG